MGDFEIPSPKENAAPVASPWPLETENPHPSKISEESWVYSEKVIKWMIWRIQPTTVSDERRRNVVEYVQKLIKGYLGYEVFPFGSVPLKTYLPDGDIDLTSLGPPNYEDSLAANVRSVLEGEEQNRAAEFQVRDVQYIHAEVKLVKCLIQNIVVDISFNQIGGISTLCFLEQVDDKIGKDQLFKRTIILIKAWCYYESRILGAHHSLLSTYALETLILYIFQLFHPSLDGPLTVLYRFLDYFSKFDWDRLCVSLNGPVCLSSLPKQVVESSEIGGSHNLLLSTTFLNKCTEKYSGHPRAFDHNRFFVKKYLNIIDPLRENNNLGRSISKGNLYRIRSAFAYGARKLGKILLLSSREKMSSELKRYFKNTLERHGNGDRLDVQDNLYSGFPDGIEDLNGNDRMACRTSGSSERSHPSNGKMLGEDDDGDKKPLCCAYTNGIDLPSSDCGEVEAELSANMSRFCLDTDVPNRIVEVPSSSICGLARDETELFDEDQNPDDYDLADLRGNHEVHLNNLRYAQYTHDFLNRSVSPGNLLQYPPYSFSGQLYAPINGGGGSGGGYYSCPPFPTFYQMNQGFIPQLPYNMEDRPKPRGTGTYIPTPTNSRAFREKSSIGGRGGRNQQFPSSNLHQVSKNLQNNGSRSITQSESNLTDVRGNGRGKSTHIEYTPVVAVATGSGTSSSRKFPAENNHLSENLVQYGSLDQAPPLSSSSSVPATLEHGGSLESNNNGSQISGSSPLSPSASSNNERLEQSYHLKDDEEFPPLSSRWANQNASSSSSMELKPAWEAKG